MVKLFFVPLLVAATLVVICYPMYKKLTKFLWHRPTLGALSSCFIIICCALVPAYAMGYVLANQGIHLYATAEPKIMEFLDKGENGPLGNILHSTKFDWLHKSNLDLNSLIKQGVSAIAGAAATAVNKTSSSIFGLLFSLVVIIFTMYFLFIDGAAFVSRLNYLVPLRQEYKERLFKKFLQTSRATVTAVLLIGIIQGTMSAITLLAFGIKSWMLWWMVMILLSMIPMVGSGFVVIPAAIIQITMGNVWQGIVMSIISLGIIANVDNFLRPYIVGRQAKMHILIIFFSTIGGLAVFGIMGVIVGPVIASMFVTLIDIYGDEFKEYLESK
jgi:predicted PurR-regulated permease PerM